jgi:hypothetical protein
MPCQCGTDAKTTEAGCQCGTTAGASCQCGTCAPTPERSIEALVKDLDERLRTLETSR